MLSDELKDCMSTDYKIRIVAIAKDEGAYLPVWIYHHLHFGFDEIEVYINNTTDFSQRILDEIGKKYPVSYILADYMYKEEGCVHFQKYAYNIAYKKAVKEGVTHLIFLDIDEFWTPLDLKSKIYTCISECKTADIISFEWANKRNEEEPFSFPYSPQILVNKSHLTKSIFNTSARIKEIGVHNVVVEEIGDKTNVLADGTAHTIPCNYAVECSHVHTSPIKQYFILHRMWRSQVEYISLLGQGIRQAPDGERAAFKTNRVGYLLPGINRITTLTFSPSLVEELQRGYKAFVEECNIKKLIDDNQFFVLKKCSSTLVELKKNSHDELVKNITKNINLEEVNKNQKKKRKELKYYRAYICDRIDHIKKRLKL